MDSRLFGVVWFFALACTQVVPKALCQALGETQKGFVSYYSGSSPPEAAPAPAPATEGGGLYSGACGFGQLDSLDWPYNAVVSVGPNNSIVNSIGANKLGCGQCIKATCSSFNCARNSSAGVVLWITDGCPSCESNQLNVPAEVFQRYFGSSLALGQVNTTFQEVNCNPPGPIVVRVVQSRADDGGYIGIALFSVAGSGLLAGVDLKTSGSQTWAPMANGYGNVWEAANFGEPPLDLRFTDFVGQILVAEGVIDNITDGFFPTNVQFDFQSPTMAPAASPPSGIPSATTARPPPPQSAFSPSVSIGVRINSPLYFAPQDVTALTAYPGLIFSYIECFGTPVLNITIDRIMIPSTDGPASPAFGIHSLEFGTFNSSSNSPLYKLVDYSYFNLETGLFAQLYSPVYASFSNSSYDGSVPSYDFDAKAIIYPRYLSPANLSSPAGLDYAILLPPGPNEDPTASYLKALETLYYFLATQTLGSSGTSETHLTCSPGYAQMGPWADYLRSVLEQLAPPAEVQNGLYDGIPLGTSFSFQDTSFVISNAVIVVRSRRRLAKAGCLGILPDALGLQGEVVNSTRQLSSRDCGASCRGSQAKGGDLCRQDIQNLLRATRLAGGPLSCELLCSAWSWCGSISGCGGSTPYETCQLKDSTPELNTTASNGFLNLQKNSSIRFTSGVLSLPPPTGISLYAPAEGSGSGYDLLSSISQAPAP